jgi:hypothetical protein
MGVQDRRSLLSRGDIQLLFTLTRLRMLTHPHQMLQLPRPLNTTSLARKRRCPDPLSPPSGWRSWLAFERQPAAPLIRDQRVAPANA